MPPLGEFLFVMSASLIIDIISDDDEEENYFSKPKPKFGKPSVATKNMDDDDDEDDCVILDGDPFKAIVPVREEYTGSVSGGELVVVGEKGQLVACRDYPHARHLCVKFPFSTTRHVTHCELCYCYVCDSPAPCVNWGNGVSDINHCNATDKMELWKTLRRNNNSKKRKNTSIAPSLPASFSKEPRNDEAAEHKPCSAAPTPDIITVEPPKLDGWQKINRVSKRTKTIGTWSSLGPPNVGNLGTSSNPPQSCLVGSRDYNVDVVTRGVFSIPLFKRLRAGGGYLPAKRPVVNLSSTTGYTGLSQYEGGGNSTSMAASSDRRCYEK